MRVNTIVNDKDIVIRVASKEDPSARGARKYKP